MSFPDRLPSNGDAASPATPHSTSNAMRNGAMRSERRAKRHPRARMGRNAPRAHGASMQARGVDIVDIVVGSHFQESVVHADADAVLIFETAKTAMEYENRRVEVRHMTVDERTPVPAHVPSRSAERAGHDGAALDSSYSRRIVLSKRAEIRNVIERKVSGAKLIRLFVSSGGGTGTGAEAEIRKILREIQIHPEGRIIALHHYSTVEQRTKMVMSLKGLLFEE